MGPEQRQEFRERIKRAEAEAAKRGLRIIGYEFRDDRFRFDYASAKAVRAAAVEQPTSRRGIHPVPPQDLLL